MKKLLILAMIFGFYTQFNVSIQAEELPTTIRFPESLQDPMYLYTDVSVSVLEGIKPEDKEAIRTILIEYDHLANNFRGPMLHHENPIYYQNNLFSINEQAGLNPVVVDELLYDMIKESLDLYNETEGYFNPALGNVIDAWKEVILSNEYMYLEIPESVFTQTMSEVNALKDSIDPDKVVLDDTQKSVYISQTGMKLDLGAFAKGHAAKAIEAYLKSQSYEHYLINIGSSTLSIGTLLDDQGNDRDVAIGLIDPLGIYEGKSGTLYLRNKSISTSGNYIQYALYQGKKYHHIISPFELIPMHYYHSITLVGDDAATLDGLSTALFNMPLDKAKEVLDAFNIAGVFYKIDGEIETYNLSNDMFVLGTKKPVEADVVKQTNTLYFILGGVIIIGGAALTGLTLLEKKKKGQDSHNEEKQE